MRFVFPSPPAAPHPTPLPFARRVRRRIRARCGALSPSRLRLRVRLRSARRRHHRHQHVRPSSSEPVAGARGYVSQHDGQFFLAGSDRPVRFWGVNGPSHHAKTPEQLAREARLLARYGVNLVRVHGSLYDRDGTLKPERVRRAVAIARAMKREGIYVLYSIYFPLRLSLAPTTRG